MALEIRRSCDFSGKRISSTIEGNDLAMCCRAASILFEVKYPAAGPAADHVCVESFFSFCRYLYNFGYPCRIRFGNPVVKPM